jgi:hypothetical protein
MEIRRNDLLNKKNRKKPWEWNPRKEFAAHSTYCNTELSRRLGISRTTLYAWQQAPGVPRTRQQQLEGGPRKNSKTASLRNTKLAPTGANSFP